jgi:hypothetical protein
MSAVAIHTESTAFKIGWSVLTGISVLSVLSYVVLIFVAPGLVDSFIAWATFSLYSMVVLLMPYRRGERWAWYLTWALPIPSLVLSLNNPEAAPFYVTAAGLMVIGQLLTRSAFFTGVESPL